jgi:hypothetical protein
LQKKRGQAALEFLMTYGWAILVVLAAIGALAYFGVIKPERFLPEKCTIAPGIDCAGFDIRTTSAELSLRNGMGKDLLISSVVIGGNCSMVYTEPQVFQNGDLMNIKFTGCKNGDVGDRFRQDMTLSYTEKETGIQKMTNGNIVARILQ